VVLTSRRFATIDGVPNQLDYEHSVYGDTMLTNGTPGAQYTLPRQMVRLRLLNAEIQREYNIGFSDGRTFYVIGTDGGLLSAPVPMTHLVMAPAERYEIAVDLTNDNVGLAIDSSAQWARFGIEARLRRVRERVPRRARQPTQLQNDPAAAHQRRPGHWQCDQVAAFEARQ
jgi:FtsP/CotA-like multicopper oxidase with cupredoxin domain